MLSSMFLKRLMVGVGGAAVLGLAPGAWAQGSRQLGPLATHDPIASVHFGGAGDSGPSGPGMRTLEGMVKDANEKPQPGALVYVKNLKTGDTLSMTADDKGHFRFVALAKETDYEFWAQEEKRKSETKTISAFDDSMHIGRNLTITTAPAPAPTAAAAAGSKAAGK